ncbi:hypothetical protein ACTUHY_05745 [Acidaminococcus sp. LBK-2]|uniref:hypothetical protein n=1 Tax=Acidaminococcus sp. LBK-2 TaxID=3456956 RepID=UPI003FA41DCE
MTVQEKERLVKLFEKETVSFAELRRAFPNFCNECFCVLAGIGPDHSPGNLIVLKDPKGPCKEGYPMLRDDDLFCLTEAGEDWRYRMDKEQKAKQIAYISCFLSGIAAIAAVISLLC